ncbi:MAG: NUDIX hydrolase [Clostridiales bacterium]|nr:NUDIX hydrolase [Clostridiales bacterium]
MELWDAYYKDGTPAGCDLVRGEPIPPGLYHKVCQIILRHRDGDYLLMQRDLRKPNYGGWFEATAGGSVLKGEDKLTCVRRELREETGLSLISLKQIGTYVSHNTLYFNYLGITDCEKSSVRLQNGETIAYKWLTEAEFIAFVNSEEMIPSQKKRYAEYLTEIGYLKK